MANRRTSWRRAPANAQPHHRRPQKIHAALPFSGVEDAALVTLFTHLLAKNVNVNAANGAVYSGLFAGTQHSPSNDLLLTLRFARLVRGKPVPNATVHDLRGTTAARIHIPFSGVTTVLGAPLHSAKPAFATDAQITRGSSGAGRQLQRFDDFSNLPPPTASAAPAPTLDQETFGPLAAPAAGPARPRWDQFQVNQAKFGVTTSFDETQYTTTIDRKSKDFTDRKREAERLAVEIESAPSQNVHVREERNQDTGIDFDEEARYSGVQRPQNSTQQPRAPAPAKGNVPERPRLSYAAAAAAATHPDPRHVPVRPPSAGATHVAAAASKAPVPQMKTTAADSKHPQTTTSKHAQQTSKAPQEQNTKHGQGTARGAQATAAKGSAASGKAGSQASKSLNRKGPSATTKPQHHQQKSLGVNSKTANQPQSSKSGSQSTNTRPTTQVVNSKSSGTAAHARPTTSSTRPAGSAQSSSAQQEQNQTKSTTPKTNVTASASNKDKFADEKSKSAVRDRTARDSLPQLAKARAAITGRTSPNQSRNSPLPTPAVADTSAIGVLNLDAQTPNLGPEQIKKFEAYKTKREFQSIAANREKITDDLKKFSTQLDSKNGSMRRGQNSGITNGSSSPGTPRGSGTPRGPGTPRGSGTPRGPSTPRSSMKVSKAVISENGMRVEKNLAKEDSQKENEKSDSQATVEQGADSRAAQQAPESTFKPRPRPKSRLNPNAMEFKPSPEAPSFTPAQAQVPHKSPVQNTPQYAAPYPQASGPIEYSQQMQIPQGYALPIQAMTPMPYGAQPYVVVPTVPTQVPGGNGSAYPFVQQPPSFSAAHVAGRFPQSAGVPVSYGYQQVTPMVMAQPPQQRVPTSPYYYNSGPYGAGQAPGGHMPGPHQPHVYQQGAPTHMQGGMQMAGRGGHGNARRGGPNRSRGKHYLQQPYPHAAGTNTGDRATVKSPEGARAPDGAQR